MSSRIGESDDHPRGAGDGLTRRGVLAGVSGLAATAAAAPAARGAPSTVRQLATPRNGTNALEVFGSIAQDGNGLTGYGYLTRISGLRAGLLFAGPDQGEATARFTFFATAKVTARFARAGLFSVTATGSVGIFLQEAGGSDFGNPASFSRGVRVANHSARFQTVVTVIAPDHALINVDGELVQKQARAFTLAARRYRLGRPALGVAMSAAGQGTRTDPAVPRAIFDVAGHFLLAG